MLFSIIFSARLSNGLQMYQRSGKEAISPSIVESNVTQGYYTLKINSSRYLTIYYTISDSDYTVKGTFPLLLHLRSYEDKEVIALITFHPL